MINMDKSDLISFENEILELFKQAKISTPIYLSGGNEDYLIEIFKEIKPGDYVFSTHRAMSHFLLKTKDKDKLKKMILDGKAMQLFDRKNNFFSSSIVAACPAIAAGVALALKKKNKDSHVFCFIGDGAEDEGNFYEAVRYVDGWDLPCTFIIEDNDRSVTTPKKYRYNKSVMNWPKCVRRYTYQPKYPHTGDGTRIDFSKCNFKENKPYNKENITIKHTHDVKDITIQDAIKMSMENLAKDPNTIFIGYNVLCGNKAYQTLINIPDSQLLETPLAENLMAGLAMGLSLEGFKPVLFFERQDFILNALDIIVNNIDKIERLSYGEYVSPVIIRATIGSRKPLYPGPTHCQDFEKSLKEMLNMPVLKPKTPSEILDVYETLKYSNKPAIVIEDRDSYNLK